MPYRNRRSVTLQNEVIRVTALVEGGHIAEIFHRATGVNPLWTPTWPTIEPSRYSLQKHPEYGDDAESRLLAGIMGHLVCLDLYGPPGETEAAAGQTVHGEAAVSEFEVSASAQRLQMFTEVPSGLRFTRTLELDGGSLRFRECVENLTPYDRPIAWTQHVTLGAPFLERGETLLRHSTVRSLDYATQTESACSSDPYPYSAELPRSAFRSDLNDPAREQSFFAAWSPRSQIAFGYAWQTSDFPWLGIWEEARFRTAAPWNGETVALGMEFGVSPVPESRRRMIGRGSLFGVPTYLWLPARTSQEVRYAAVIGEAPEMPSAITLEDGSARF